MSQPIPTSNHKPRSLSITHAQMDPNSALYTPGGTPPLTAGHEHSHGHFETRLQQLLSNFESGTHSFDRAERETPEERRMSFGSDVFPTPPSSRRPSFLSSLGITRPFAFTPTTPSSPSSTPLSTSHNDKFPSNLHMTSASPSSSSSRPALEKNIHGYNTQSTPNVPHYEKEEGQLPASMSRSKTTSHLLHQQPHPLPQQTKKQNGFINQKDAKGSGQGQGQGPPYMGHGAGNGGLQAQAQERRHFDPSREPKLLGLL
ncbi:uncharacterized protein I303_103817 [Kwoniella dejecticola CBS 10117]|uniref:Uncharacterized protein n=1 Tax=Kwoniella dejecticola CBS 10117 TaxID=1296121 RepID=A0A1A6A7T3_9TREE|nr:uncharacterized protein I303_03836 [Kwoniella dejecticola CBS 10117]OBR86116.1 hypothetical protein I303_03836 [Kwoniella dejecticola CBS 10117]